MALLSQVRVGSRSTERQGAFRGPTTRRRQNGGPRAGSPAAGCCAPSHARLSKAPRPFVNCYASLSGWKRGSREGFCLGQMKTRSVPSHGPCPARQPRLASSAEGCCPGHTRSSLEGSSPVSPSTAREALGLPRTQQSSSSLPSRDSFVLKTKRARGPDSLSQCPAQSLAPSPFGRQSICLRPRLCELLWRSLHAH